MSAHNMQDDRLKKGDCFEEISKPTRYGIRAFVKVIKIKLGGDGSYNCHPDINYVLCDQWHIGGHCDRLKEHRLSWKAAHTILLQSRFVRISPEALERLAR